jgi:hypothetical protein
MDWYPDERLMIDLLSDEPCELCHGPGGFAVGVCPICYLDYLHGEITASSLDGKQWLTVVGTKRDPEARQKTLP